MTEEEQIEKDAVESFKILIKDIKTSDFTPDEAVKMFREGLKTGMNAAKKICQKDIKKLITFAINDGNDEMYFQLRNLRDKWETKK